MISLTNAELCMLEQLTYLDEDVAAAAGANTGFEKIHDNSYSTDIGKTIADLMQDLSCLVKNSMT